MRGRREGQPAPALFCKAILQNAALFLADQAGPGRLQLCRRMKKPAICHAFTLQITGLPARRRAWDSNPQPIAGHLISSRLPLPQKVAFFSAYNGVAKSLRTHAQRFLGLPLRNTVFFATAEPPRLPSWVR